MSAVKNSAQAAQRDFNRVTSVADIVAIFDERSLMKFKRFSLENRVQFSLRGGNELMIKPFNLLELALRSVSLIIKSRLKGRPTPQA